MSARSTFQGPRCTAVRLGLLLVVWAGFALPAAGAVAAVEDRVEIFPLDQVEPGQEATWRTVVEGEEIGEFPLRILGVVNDFIGPRMPAIIAEALDPENVLSGPVAGMSGSPVYIDGKLLGAYAYGYTWAKEQAIIGITPIEQMFPLLDYPEDAPGSLDRVPGVARRPRSSEEALGKVERLIPAHAGGTQGVLRALPTPLSLSGFSPRTIELFRDELEALGFAPAAGPAGRNKDIPLNLRPGAPVAGVVMSGDFSAAATGTVTWVDGDRFLAFGHPFLQAGTVALPMAGAEIVTVVRNVQSSFKLANVGEPEGRIVQDRLAGIAGRRGDVPAMANLRVSVDWSGERVDRFESQLWKHPQMLPLMVAMGALQSLDQAVSREWRETVTLRGSLSFANGKSLPLHSVRTGPDALNSTALNLLQKLNQMLDNPFGPLEVSDVAVELSIQPEWQASALRQVRLGDARPKAGRDLPVMLELRDYWGEPRTLEVNVPLPPRARSGEVFHLIVTGAHGANQLLGVGEPAPSADSLEDWLRPLRDARPENALYVFLVAGDGGIEIGGQALRDLPPSVRASLGSSATHFIEAPVRPRVLWEEQIPVEGTFTGSDRLTLTLE